MPEHGESLDPRIRRTRRMLQESLAKLLERKNFDEISVQDIAAEATVNRATFYDHYTDKYGLLNCLVGSRFDDLLRERGICFEGPCNTALKNMITAVAEFVARLRGSGNRPIEPHMESAMIAVIRRMLLEGLKRHPGDDAIPAETVASAAAWAIYGGVKEGGASQPAGQMAEQIATLVSPMMHRAYAQQGTLQTERQPQPSHA